MELKPERKGGEHLKALCVLWLDASYKAKNTVLLAVLKTIWDVVNRTQTGPKHGKHSICCTDSINYTLFSVLSLQPQSTL